MQEQCCKNPAIQSMDYRWPIFANPEDQQIKVNRICLRCFAHWFGVEPEVKRYTSKEWDVYVEAGAKD